MQLSGRRVVIVGLGRSGLAAARLCVEHGAQVMGTDAKDTPELVAAARAMGMQVFLGGHDQVPFETADLVVISPGVPAFAALTHCEERGVPVIGELELAWRFASAPVLAVGGTNGKSTTTALLARLLEAQGLAVFAGGNLGVPLSEVVGKQHDVLVLEVSSFQLERAPTFRPRVSVLLNVTDDHLDRYQGFQDYAAAKGNAFVNQQPSDFAIVPAHDDICREQAERGRGKILLFALAQGDARDDCVDYLAERAQVRERHSGLTFDLSRAALHGQHNWLNAAAAIAAARCHGAEPSAISAGLKAFEALPHRMALAGVVAGVPYYDDSKGTNVGAVVTALGGLAEPRAVLIAGGRDKQGSYAPLRAALAQKGRAVVLIGEAAERIAAELADVVPVERAPSMDAAVQIAAKLAQKGDAVLLSPACSSFDMFSGYAARGDAFVEAVRRLGHAEKQ